MNCQPLACNQSDREMLVDRATFQSLSLNPEYRPDWSHALFIRKAAWKWSSDREGVLSNAPRVYEHMAIHTQDGEYFYYFVAARARSASRAVANASGLIPMSIIHLCDEVIQFGSFVPDLGKVNYAKCRSMDTKQLGASETKKKFIQDFMSRT